MVETRKKWNHTADVDKETIEKATIAYLTTTKSSCPRCCHSLRETTSPRCPECGLKIKIALDRYGPIVWFIGLCSFIVCLGISVDQIGWFTLPVIVFGNNPMPYKLILPETVGLVVFLTSVFYWWKIRQKSLLWTSTTKTIIVVCSILLPIAYFSVLFTIFMVGMR
jgi:hypothetical protein